VTVYPSRLEISTAALGGDPNANPLVRAVGQLIQRRQATVRPGDLPYRPEVRFLVRPQFERTFLTAYPAQDGLAVPKSRQMLRPEDDVAFIVAGD
jgi:hypothetical protein